MLSRIHGRLYEIVKTVSGNVLNKPLNPFTNKTKFQIEQKQRSYNDAIC